MAQPLAALLLAAGASRRMGGGRLKQLLPLGGRPVLRWSLDALAAGGVTEIVVVLSPGVDAGEALAGTRATVAFNPDPGSDMAGSVRAGLTAIGPRASGMLVLPADHPLVSAASVRALVERHEARPEAILIPCHRGRRGHPALFPATLAREVAAGRTLREVRDSHPERVEDIGVEDPGVVFDMDTWEDYLEARRLVEGNQGTGGRKGDAR